MKSLNLVLFAKVLGMTGSDHDGECLVAIRRANAMLTAAGVTWSEVVSADLTESDPFGPEEPASWSPSHRAQEVRLGREHMVRAKMLLASGFPWDEWKAGFLRSMAIRDASLTDSQRAKLRECEALVASWKEAA